MCITCCIDVDKPNQTKRLERIQREMNFKKDYLSIYQSYKLNKPTINRACRPNADEVAKTLPLVFLPHSSILYDGPRQTDRQTSRHSHSNVCIRIITRRTYIYKKTNNSSFIIIKLFNSG